MIAPIQSMLALDEKRIIVTGGGRGIGIALVIGIIEAGGHVGILDILNEPHTDCKALIETSGRCHYFKYVSQHHRLSRVTLWHLNENKC